ncbi:hypothetical protein J6590_081072 [Homalodisca vitripennis]|nr:hypothetical protein J6590_081072 [Homalodisca vitripennis]
MHKKYSLDQDSNPDLSLTGRRSEGRSGAAGERVFLFTFTIKCFAIGSSYFSLTNGALARLNFSVGRQRDNCYKYVSSTHFSLGRSCRDINIQDYVQTCSRISGNESEAPALPYVVVGLSGSCRDNNIQDYVQSCSRISGTEAEAQALTYVAVGLGRSCRDNNIQDYVQTCSRISGTEAETPALPYVVVGLGGSCRDNNILDCVQSF